MDCQASCAWGVKRRLGQRAFEAALALMVSPPSIRCGCVPVLCQFSCQFSKEKGLKKGKEHATLIPCHPLEMVGVRVHGSFSRKHAVAERRVSWLLSR